MILTTKQKRIVRTTIFMGILLISGFSAMNNGLIEIENVPEQVNHIKSIPSSSAFWTNTSITIDADVTTNSTHSGNWTWAVAQDWCSGLGNEGQPYLIENMTFDADINKNGLLIQDSVDIYFTIQNCTFTNALSSGYAGLKLDHTTNGTIIDCNATSNNLGFSFVSSSYNVIESNIADSNDFGIEVKLNSNYNEISFNTVQDSYRSGIFLYSNSDNNIIYNNTLSQNAVMMISTWGGITISFHSDYNEVYNNTAYQSNLYMDRSSHNTIIDNTFESGSNGIYLGSSTEYNSMINNTITNYNYGFRCGSNLENQIIGNNFINCNNYGMYLSGPKNNTITDNVITNSNYGIYAYGSSGENNSLIGNQIFGSITCDIFIEMSDNWNLMENTMETKGLLIRDIYHNQIDTSNTVQGKPIYYYEDQNDLDLDGDIITNIGQLFLINSNNSVISNFNFNNLAVGLYIDGGNHLSILNNNLSNNGEYGLYLRDINQSSIIGNTVCDNKYGIYNTNDYHDDWDEDYPDLSLLFGENIFSENIVNNNEQHGIEIYLSKLDTISNNVLNNNTQDGLFVESVYNGTISGNIISLNNATGITIDSGSNNTIFQNRNCGHA